MSVSAQIRIRRDFAANFTSADPTLALGEIAFETDTKRFKVGDGSTQWTLLGYAAQNATSITVTDTTDSTDKDTGAVIVEGGVGIEKRLNVGGAAAIAGNTTVSSSTASTTTGDGALVVTGGAGIGGAVNVGGAAGIAGITSITNSTASSSTTNGALVVTGGVGIGGGINAGSDAVFNGVRVGQGPAGADNTVVGNGAGSTLGASANYNVLIGRNAGVGISDKDFNVAIGFGAQNANATAVTAIGDRACRVNTGTGNTAVGYAAVYKNVNGDGITAVGSSTLYEHVPTGNSYSTAIGTSALNQCTTGTQNTAVGFNASALLKTANSTTAVGLYAALRNLTNDITCVGAYSLFDNCLATGNNAFGRNSLNDATSSINAFTTTPTNGGTGYTANQTGVTVTLVKKSGTDTFGGTVEASLTTDGSGVVTAVAAAPVSAGIRFTGTNIVLEPSGFGGGSGCEITIASLVSASSNTAMGHLSAELLVSGSHNSAFGTNALDALTSGSRNSAFGFDALGAATGSDNTALGSDAGDGVSTGSQNTCIGSGTDTSAAGDSNSTVIGYNAVGDGSNTVVIGNSSVTQSRMMGGTFLSTGANGQSTQLGQATTLLTGLTGATATATNLIPANCILLGVTARVTAAITGATTFDIGDGSTADRFGDDIAIALGTTANNCIAPALVTAATNVVLTANGSNFTAGAVRVTAHYMTLVAPTS